jgi:hypothetical protein
VQQQVQQPRGTRLAVVFEPTRPTWLPIAVFFARRGHAVYHVSSAKAADLRRFLRRHAKSNGIDADTPDHDTPADVPFNAPVQRRKVLGGRSTSTTEPREPLHKPAVQRA